MISRFTREQTRSEILDLDAPFFQSPVLQERESRKEIDRQPVCPSCEAGSGPRTSIGLQHPFRRIRSRRSHQLQRDLLVK